MLLAGTAALATAGIDWSVLALAVHYDDQYLQMARAQSAASTMHVRVAARPPRRLTR